MGLLAKIFGTNDNIIKDPIRPQEFDNTPEPDATKQDQPFDPNNCEPGFMAIDDIYGIKGGNAVVVGRVDSGYFYTDQIIAINTSTGPIQTTVAGIECFHKLKSYAAPGEYVGLLIKDVDKNLIKRNDTVRGQ